MLEHWIPAAKHRFTGADLDFLASVLAHEDQRPHVEKLWSDPDALREMLDLKEVLRGILDSPYALQLSPHFYFYVLVRHAFLQSGLKDADLANYVAGVMSKRISSAPGDSLEDVARGFTHASDFIAIISSAKGKMRFHLQMAAGNQFLLLTGLYPDFLKSRSQKFGAPDLEFYESFAQKAFGGAANNRRAPHKASRNLLGALSDAMPTARL